MNNILLQDFYQVNSSDFKGDLSSFKTEVSLNASHAVFHGHFPGTPVVPGVCIIQIIREILERNCGKKLNIRSADNIKFLAMVDPREKKDLSFTFANQQQDTLISCTVTCRAGETICVKFKGQFEVL